jgi:hypothetical protein
MQLDLKREREYDRGAVAVTATLEVQQPTRIAKKENFPMEYQKPVLLDLGRALDLIQGAGAFPKDPDMTNRPQQSAPFTPWDVEDELGPFDHD